MTCPESLCGRRCAAGTPVDLEVHLRPSAMRNMTFAVRLFEDGTWRRRLDGVNHAHAVNRTTHKERVARRRREWKLNRTRTRDAQRKHTHAESATCYGHVCGRVS